MTDEELRDQMKHYGLRAVPCRATMITKLTNMEMHVNTESIQRLHETVGYFEPGPEEIKSKSAMPSKLATLHTKKSRKGASMEDLARRLRASTPLYERIVCSQVISLEEVELLLLADEAAPKYSLVDITNLLEQQGVAFQKLPRKGNLRNLRNVPYRTVPT